MQHLLLLHGALGSEKQLAPLVALLKDSYHVHAIDFEGHGGRPGDGAFSFEGFSETIKVFLSESGVVKCSIFGYSMGGYAALKFALLNPGIAERIITLATKFEWSPEIAEKETAMLNPEKILEKVPKFAASLEALHAPLDWKEVMKKTADLMRSLGDGKGLSDKDLHQIDVPVLLCLGSEDQMVSREETEDAAGKLGNGKTHTIEGAQHMLERTDPELIAEAIKAFIG